MRTNVGGGSGLAIGEAFVGVLGAARSGAPGAWERLYLDLAPAVAGYLRLQGAAEPEDLTSEVFLGVFGGLRKFTGSEQQFRSWVFTIAHRRLIDERRRSARRPAIPTGDFDAFDRHGGDAEQDALDALGSRRVFELCAGLTAEQREVVLLRVVADLTVEQVARVVGRSVGAVKALQRRGFDALRQRVEWEGVPL